MPRKIAQEKGVALEKLAKHTISTTPPDVGFHMLVAVFCANVALCSQQVLYLLLCCTQNGR
jgi:hypothetical protein